jgi:hypothetical protein
MCEAERKKTLQTLRRCGACSPSPNKQLISRFLGAAQRQTRASIFADRFAIVALRGECYSARFWLAVRRAAQKKKLGLGRLHKKRLKKEDVSTRAFSKTENILRSSVLAREDNDSKNNWNVRKYYF